MEKFENSNNSKRKLLSHHWNLNSNKYESNLSFNWMNNEIRIEVHAFCNPPGRDKHIHFDFFINGEHTFFKFSYNCYGGGKNGRIPQLKKDNYLITFHASPQLLEVYMEESQETTPDKDNQEKRRKDSWISVYDHFKTGMRYENPIEDSRINFWIKKSFSHQYSSDVLIYDYQLYTKNLRFIPLSEGDFTCHRMFDYCKSIGCGVYSYIGCEISDKKGNYRKFYFGRIGLEELSIFEIIKFLRSLQSYYDWNDYDNFEDTCNSMGTSIDEIYTLFSGELKNLNFP